MVMTTSSHYQGMVNPSCGSRTEPRSSAARNAVALARNPVGAQRISGSMGGGTFNNNSMSKAIKTMPSAATARAAARTSQKYSQSQSQAYTQSPILTRTRTSASLERSNNGRSKPSTWDEMLSARTKASSHPSDVLPTPNCNASTLQQFDPHRTLAFLITELNSKLKTSLPEDKTVHRILGEVRCTLKRIGNTSQSSRLANVTSDTNLIQPNSMKCCNSFAQTDKHRHIRCYEKSIQTEGEHSRHSKSMGKDSILTSTRRDNSPPSSQESIFSTLKRSCSPMGKCHSPKKRATAENESSREKSSVRCKTAGVDSERKESKKAKKLKPDEDTMEKKLEMCEKEIDELKAKVLFLEQRIEAANVREAHLIQELQNRCKLLQQELKTLQDIVKKQTNELSVVQEFSTKLKESTRKINFLEKSKLEADRILVFTKMEKEKLAILQNFQEKQVSTLQSEVNQLTTAVREQLEDIHQNTSTIRSNAIDDKYPKHKSKSDYVLKSPIFLLEEKMSSKDEKPQEYTLNTAKKNNSLDPHKPEPATITKQHQLFTTTSYSRTKCEGSLISEKPSKKYNKYYAEKPAQKDDPVYSSEKGKNMMDITSKPKGLSYETESTYLIDKNRLSRTAPRIDDFKSKSISDKSRKKDSSQRESEHPGLKGTLEKSAAKKSASSVMKDTNQADNEKFRRNKGGHDDKTIGRYQSNSNYIKRTECEVCEACHRPFEHDDGPNLIRKNEPVFSYRFKEKFETDKGRKPPPSPQIASYHHPGPSLSFQPPQPPSHSTPSSARHRAYMFEPELYLLEEHHQSKDNASRVTNGMESG